MYSQGLDKLYLETHQLSNIFINSSNSDSWKIREGLGPWKL